MNAANALLLVKIAPESLTLTEGKQIIGNIVIECGVSSFPDKNWTDFVVVILLWWAQGVLKLKHGNSTRELLRFMDGPFEIEITRQGNIWSAAFYESGKKSFESRFSFDEFEKNLQSAIKSSLEVVSKYRWDTPDAKKLAQIVVQWK